MGTATKTTADTRTNGNADRTDRGDSIDAAAISTALDGINRKLDKQQRILDGHTHKLNQIGKKQDTTEDSLLTTKIQSQLMAMGLYVLILATVWFVQAVKDAAADLPKWMQRVIGIEAIAPASDLPIEQQAFLDTIAQMEGADYTTIYGGSTFSDFSDHPQQCIPINLPGYEGQCSDAAGKYQFLSTTWRTLGMPDFSPESQDKAAIALIKRDAPDAIPLLNRGEIEMAFREVADIWASLPGNSYGQNPKDMATVLAAYEANLAALKTAQASGIDVELGNDGAIALSSSAPLKSGDMVGTFRVSRGIIPGEHDGVDLATPEGTPLFVFGEKGEKITVECHEQMNGGSYSGWGIYGTFHVPSTGKSFLVGHLSECNAGTYDAGQVWGYSGNTGKSTGPHTHTEQFTGKDAGMSAKPEEPSRAFVKAIHGME